MKRLLLLYFMLILHAAQAQNSGSSSCTEIITKFNNFYNNGDYAIAMPLLRNALENCPAVSESIYVKGALFYEKLVAAENNIERRYAFADSLLGIYDRHIRYFNNYGIITGKKGLALFRFVPPRKYEAIQLLGNSIDSTKAHTHHEVLLHYFQGSAQLYNEHQLSAEELAGIFYKVSMVYDANRGIPEYDDFNSKTIALFSVLFSCESIEKIYEPRLKINPDSTLLMQEFVQLCNKRKCTGSQLYVSTAEKLYRKGPTPLSSGSLAQITASKGQPERAAGYFNDAIEMESDAVKKAILLMDAAEFQLLELKSFPQSRTMALRAAALHPKWGRPWLFIGDLYFNSAGSCNEILNGSPVYWAAYDKYLKAKTVDPSVTLVANRKSEKCSGLFPGKIELFELKIKEGDSYEVKCWIGEKTTVRSRK